MAKRRGSKLNVDATVAGEGKIGAGFILRDANGEIIIAAKQELEGGGSSTLIEGLAMRQAMKTLKHYHMKATIIESDRMCLINTINGKSEPEPYCDIIIKDIGRLAEEIEAKEFRYVAREANQSSHLPT